MLWAVKGYDSMYQGLHGMFDIAIVEGTEFDAIDVGRELSDSVIGSYNSIYNDIEESAQDIWEQDKTQDYDEILAEVYEEAICYEYHELDVEKLPTTNLRTLEKLYYNNEEEFLSLYAKN